jgi:hypothetical protein
MVLVNGGDGSDTEWGNSAIGADVGICIRT